MFLKICRKSLRRALTAAALGGEIMPIFLSAQAEFKETFCSFLIYLPEKISRQKD
jgi:hypothetical protein